MKVQIFKCYFGNTSKSTKNNRQRENSDKFMNTLFNEQIQGPSDIIHFIISQAFALYINKAKKALELKVTLMRRQLVND